MSDDIERIIEEVRNRSDRDKFPEGSYGRLIGDIVHGGTLMKKSRKEIMYALTPLLVHIFGEDNDDQKNPRDD